MPMFSVDEVEEIQRRLRAGATAQRELESIQRNVRDFWEAIGEQTYIDGQSMRRLLASVLPWEMTHAE